MNTEENIIIKSMSKALNSDIKYITMGLTMAKSKNKLNSQERPIIILLGVDNFFVFLENFKEIKLEFEYNAITKVYIDRDNPNSIFICLDKEKLKGKKIDLFHLFVKNRPSFVKSLICYHSIYNMEKFGIVTELAIKEKSFFMEYKEESLLTKGIEIIHNNPDNFKKVVKQGAEFFLKECVESEIEDGYIISTYKNEKKLSSKLIIDIGEILQIDKFQTQKDEKDIHFYSLNRFLNYMRTNEKNGKFWITKSEFYTKRFNLSIDKAKWECFKIEARQAEYLNEFESKMEGVNENLIFIFLRRKMIPPFYDSFMYIMILIKEPYETDEVEMTYDAELIIETIADSIHFPQKTMTSNEYENILESKLEALLLDEDSLEFFYNNLKITGKECYKCGLDYVYHLILTFEKQNKEEIQSVKDLYVQKLVKFNLAFNPQFDFSEHDKYIRNNDIDTIVKDFETKVNTIGSNEYFNQVKTIWEVKLWRYIVFCVDGGLTNDRFNLEEIIRIYKKVMNGSSSIVYQIQIQMNNMLNIRIYNLRDQPLDSKISTIINQINDIKSFTFNERVMNLLVKEGVLKSIQGLESDGNYANFLKYMLDNNPSVEFLKSLSYFLREISIDIEQSSTQQALRKSLNSILSSLMMIYSNFKLCPITLILACKCLTILTCSDIDKNNKAKILQDNVLEIISFNLDCQDEKLLFCTLKLLLNILPELRENIGEILYKNSNLIPKLIEVISGTGVPKTYHSIKTIQSVVIVLMNLLKMQPAVVREKLGSEKNRHLIGYLIRYLKEDDSIGEKEENLLIPLQKFIYEFLIDIIKKNPDIKKYMNETHHMIDVIQDEARRNINFIRNVVKNPESSLITYGDMIETILKKLELYLKFTFFFISQDKEFVKLIKKESDDKRNHFEEFIFVSYENRTTELVSKLAMPINSLYNELNNYEEKDYL